VSEDAGAARCAALGRTRRDYPHPAGERSWAVGIVADTGAATGKVLTPLGLRLGLLSYGSDEQMFGAE
jgi:hypothetical protein